MRRHWVLFLWVLASGLGLAGCTGLGTKPLIRSGQWEPDVVEEEPFDRGPAASSLRPKGKTTNESPVDKLIWSDTARDIHKSLGGDY